MPTPLPRKPRVFVDADVIFAGAAAPTEHGANLTVLRMAEITLIEAITSQQAVTEAECNLEAKLPATLPMFRLSEENFLLWVRSGARKEHLPRPSDLRCLRSFMPCIGSPETACPPRKRCWPITTRLMRAVEADAVEFE